MWKILTAPVFKVLYNAQLALLPLVHTFRRLGRNACEIRMLLDVRHATYVLSSDVGAGQALELNAILGGSTSALPVAVAGGGKVARVFSSLHRHLASIVGLMGGAQTKLAAISTNSWRSFVEVEMRMMVLLSCLEDVGVAADDQALVELDANLSFHINTIVEKAGQLMAQAGHQPFNLASPEQVSHALYDSLHLPPPAKTSAKGKHLSTGESDLQRIINRHPIVQMVLDFRSLTKTRNTFIEGGKNFYRFEDADETGSSSMGGARWRVHAQWHLDTTRTGRLSCSKPNLQQYPKTSTCDGVDINIRALFRPAAGKVIVAADYSQIEMRVLAHFCQDKRLCDIFSNAASAGGLESDVYMLMASMLFPRVLQPGDVERKKSKVVCLATVYGMGAEKMASDLGVSRAEVATIQAAFFNTFPGIKVFEGHARERAKRTGHVQTLLGFKRELPDLNSADGNKRAQAERQCINSIVQGSAADVIKLAMVMLEDVLARQGWTGPRLLLTVHDELVYECPTEEVDRFVALLKKVMERDVQLAFPLRVPLGINIEVGKDWGHLEKLHVWNQNKWTE